MAKKRGEKFYAENGKVYDSAEEWHFELWLEELKQFGIVESYTAQPETFQLALKIEMPYEKPRSVGYKNLEQGHKYTPDFLVVWNELKFRSLGGCVLSDRIFSTNTIVDSFVAVKDSRSKTNRILTYFEVKSPYDMHNMTRIARLNKLWLYQMYGLYVPIVKVGRAKNTLFDLTFTPNRYLQNDKTRTLRKLDFKPKKVEMFLSGK